MGERERREEKERESCPFSRDRRRQPKKKNTFRFSSLKNKKNQVRELRWNANFSSDTSEVTFDRLYYNEAYLAERSCPACSLDNDRITTVNRAYLSVLGFYGGSEMPLVLPGVPTALAGVLGAFQGGIFAGGRAQVPPIDEPTAKFYARIQWSQCAVWTPDPTALLEYCAWIQAKGLGTEAWIDPATADRVLGLLGNPAVGNPQ